MKPLKKLIVFVLIAGMLLPFMTPISYGAEAEAGGQSELSYREQKQSLSYTCYYNSETDRIDISGTVNHDVMISRDHDTIEVYRVPFGSTLHDVIGAKEPVASASISVTFRFSLKLSAVTDRYAIYAVVLRSPAGEALLAAEPQRAGVMSQAVALQKESSFFKGISSEQTAVSGSVGAGTVILPVRLDQLLSKVFNGYFYLFGQTQIYLDKDYIDRLDAEIRTHSANGSRVYLQLLLSADEGKLAFAGGAEQGAIYSMPNLYMEDTQLAIGAVSEFLASRYENRQSGRISGLIVGKSVDRTDLCYSADATAAQHAALYAMYVSVVANTARVFRPDLDIVLPFSNRDGYSQSANTTDRYSPREILETVMDMLQREYCFDFTCSTMLESDTTPLGITNENLNRGIDLQYREPEGLLGVDNLQIYEDFLESLQNKYRCAPTHYMYAWSPLTELSGNALASAYAYGYYRMFADRSAVSFIVSFIGSEGAKQNGLSHIERILRYIDTKDSSKVTERLLSYFNCQSWDAVVAGISSKNLSGKICYRSDYLPVNVSFKGSFSYFDFLSGDVSEWFAGVGCGQITSVYDANGTRALQAASSAATTTDYTELLCLYEYNENLTYTPYMKVRLALEDGSKSAAVMYQVVITVGNDTCTITSENAVRGGEIHELWLDMREYNASGMANYWKISVRALTEGTEKYSLLIYDAVGYSQEHTSEELKNLIEAERLRIRNQSAESDGEDGNDGLIWIIFGVLVAITGLGAGLFMVFSPKRREDAEELDDDHSS